MDRNMRSMCGSENEYDLAINFGMLKPEELVAIFEAMKKGNVEGAYANSRLGALLSRAVANPGFNPGNLDCFYDVLTALFMETISYEPYVKSKETEFLRQRVWLTNGGMAYIDHFKPEYCTPPCLSARDFLLHNLAGDRIMESARAKISSALGVRLTVMKNNSDGKGNSYGAHENYRISRQLFDNIVKSGLSHPAARWWLNFRVVLPIIAGAGKMGCERCGCHNPSQFEISARADLMTQVYYIGTMENRPLINTRDEPHADPGKFGRLHNITGDANMAQWPIYLKALLSNIMLKMLEADFLPEPVTLVEPVRAAHDVSCDITVKAKVIRTAEKGMVSSWDIMRDIGDHMKWFASTYDGPEKEEFKDGAEKLDFLLRKFKDENAESLSHYLDWVFKHKLFTEKYHERKDNPLPWGHATMRRADLQYHELDPEKSVFFRLAGTKRYRMESLVGESDIMRAVAEPPEFGSGFLRGEIMRRVGDRLNHHGQDWTALRIPRGLANVESPDAKKLASVIRDPAYPSDAEEKKEAIRILDAVFSHAQGTE